MAERTIASTKQQLSFNYSPYVKDYAGHGVDPLDKKAAFGKIMRNSNSNSNDFSRRSNSNSCSKPQQQQIKSYMNNANKQQANKESGPYANNLSSQKKNGQKIDFTQIMYQLSQPSTVEIETPCKQEQPSQSVFLGVEQNALNYKYLNYIPPEEEEQEIDCQRDSKESSLGISQLNDMIHGHSHRIQIRDTIEQLQQQQQYQPHQRHYTEINDDYLEHKQVKGVNIDEMVSQLDELQTHIKSLEYKLDATGKSPKSKKTSKKKLSSIGCANSRKSLQKQSFDYRNSSSRHPSSECFVDFKGQRSGRRSRSKNISWGDSQFYPSTNKKQHFNGVLTHQNSQHISSDFKRQSSGIHNKENIQQKCSTTKLAQNRSALKNIQLNEPSKQTSISSFSKPSEISRRASAAPTSSYRSIQRGVLNEDNCLQEVIFSHNRQSFDHMNQPTITSPPTLSLADMNSLPITQRNLLNQKIKEAEDYKEKCKQLKKALKLAKQQISEKDMIISNYKNLTKEMKIMKEQWLMSEDIRTEQKKKMQKMQIELIASQKEIIKLKKKLQKRNKENKEMPIKVLVSEKTANVGQARNHHHHRFADAGASFDRLTSKY